MKFKPSSFLAGALCAVLVLGIATPALAATGAFSITVNPINIEVNGEVFKPTDVDGNPVEVFEYKGTTYAPLRALAKAYGLEVGYDNDKRLAYVYEPEVEPSVEPTDKVVSAEITPENFMDESLYPRVTSVDSIFSVYINGTNWDSESQAPTTYDSKYEKGCFQTYSDPLHHGKFYRVDAVLEAYDDYSDVIVASIISGESTCVQFDGNLYIHWASFVVLLPPQLQGELMHILVLGA